MFDGGHVCRSILGSQAHQLVMEDDIHNPVQPVFDVLMGAYGCGEAPGREFCGGKETAPFDREFSLALDLSFDHSDHGEVSEAPLAGKAPVTFEPVDLAADGVSSGFNPAMISLAGIGLWVREEAFDLGAQGRPVVFEGRQIVRPLIADCPGDLGPAAHGVGGDKSSAQSQALQQSGDGGDLVGFLSAGLPA